MPRKWTKNSAFWPIASLVLLSTGLFAGASRADELADRSAVIKPSAKELGWLKIPWVLDLKVAQQTAKTEARPILLWVTGDDPLGRC